MIRRRRALAAFAVCCLAAGTALGVARLADGEFPSARAVEAPAAWRGDKAPPRRQTTRRPGGMPTEAEQRRAVERLIRLGYPILCGGGRRGRYIALTFDDGPGPYTTLMLKILRKRHLRATFFLTGTSIERFPDLPRRETELASLGNHSWSHPYLPGLSPSGILSELRRTQDLIRRRTGLTPRLFRPPYGARDADVDRIARSLGLLQVLWSIDSGDSTGSDVEGVAENIRAALGPGSIVLLHENRATTIKSLLRYVLPEIKRRGLRAVSVPELLALDPPSPEQLRSRDC
ncbi:MAG: polysaccharide deacetylase family protein [Gaiellaceae bacterium]